MTTENIQKILVTPEQASIWLNSNKINRKARNHWVDQLANQIKDGNWMLTHQAIAFSKSGMLLDGQHRLMAIEKSKIPVEMFVCFNADDEIFKAIDCGVKRSMGDLTRLDKRTSEVASRICHFVYTGRKITPERVIQIGQTKCIQIHNDLLNYCNIKTAYYSAATFRLSACLAVLEGNDFNYVADMYLNLNRVNLNTFNQVAQLLVKQVTLGSVKANNHADTLARGLKVFSEKSKNLSRLTVNNQEIKDSQEKLKKHIVNDFAMKD